MGISNVAIIAGLVNMRAEKETAVAVAWRDYASHIISTPIPTAQILWNHPIQREADYVHIIASVNHGHHT